MRKQWCHAMRRDEGKYFQIVDSKKVCLRHFKEEDFKKTLSGKICLKPNAVPSVFLWRTSPRKRKPPPQRNTITTSQTSDKSIRTTFSERADDRVPEGSNEEFTTPFTIEDEDENSAKTREVATQTDLFA